MVLALSSASLFQSVLSQWFSGRISTEGAGKCGRQFPVSSACIHTVGKLWCCFNPLYENKISEIPALNFGKAGKRVCNWITTELPSICKHCPCKVSRIGVAPSTWKWNWVNESKINSIKCQFCSSCERPSFQLMLHKVPKPPNILFPPPFFLFPQRQIKIDCVVSQLKE